MMALVCVLSFSLICSAMAAGPFTGYSVVSGGMTHTLAVMADGFVWAWGSNESGQLGRTDSKSDKCAPAQVAGLTAVSVAAGYNFSAALRSDGFVYVWGSGAATPVKVEGLSGVTAIAAGQIDLLALKTDGTVWQFSVGSNSIPVQVPGLENMTAVSAGGGFFLALSASGRIWSWGSNTYGQLGLGDTISRTRPECIGSLPEMVDIAAGFDHALAAAFDGTVYAWGANNYGQLGSGTTTDSLVPIKVPTLSNVRQVSAGMGSSMALTEKKALYTWGYGEYGQLGNNDTTTIGQTSPMALKTSGIGMPAFIASGSYHNLMVNGLGTVYSWGRNKNGQVSSRLNGNRPEPQFVMNLTTSPYKIGTYSVYALQGLHSWSEADIKALYALNLVSPMLWSNYDKKITRAEMAHLLVNVYEKVNGFTVNADTTTTFKDVEGHPLRLDILKANRLGFFNGRSAEIFDPDSCVTREEAAKMLCSFVTKIRRVSFDAGAYRSLPYYSDTNGISQWAVPFVGYAHENEILKGSGDRFNPKDNFTREQSLLTIARLAQRYSWHA